MERAGAATVLADAELSAAAGGRAAARPRSAAILGDAARLEAMAAASRALARPDAARRIADEVLAAAADEPTGALARRLHFIGIGGAGMSGLALVCARLGATVTGSDRSDSSYMERLRAGRARSGRRPRRRQPARGRRGRRLDRDRRREPGAGAGPRARASSRSTAAPCWPSSAREKRLIAVAGTHGKTTTTAMAVWALRAIGADPAFFVGGEVPGLGADGAAANAGWGEGEWVVAEADESDGSFLELQPGDRRRHQRRDGPPRALGLAGRAARGLPRVPRAGRAAVLPADGGARRPRRRRPRLGFDAEAPGPPSSTWRVPGAHNRAQRPRRPGGDRAGRARRRARPRRRSPTSPASGGGSSSRASAAAPASTTTTPTTRPRSAPRSRPCASSSPRA